MGTLQGIRPKPYTLTYTDENNITDTECSAQSYSLKVSVYQIAVCQVVNSREHLDKVPPASIKQAFMASL
ncbi:hypothetical protein Anapl_17442 [Anas platyrhynchos]|uniref:Uncharacterized protein n=1 Tax=Anas platyrhynchos TaxID=8839 RepID=R0M2J3_ANAPL|nr:hypothetical protein Anapl_17442 [Anas platyrhynchos]